MGLAEITEQDIRQALTPNGAPQAGGRVERIIENVLVELERRLGDPEACKDIPGTAFIRFGEMAFKLELERQARNEGEHEEQKSWLAMIDAAGLPLLRKRELVQARLEDMRTERDQLVQLLHRIDDERRAG